MSFPAVKSNLNMYLPDAAMITAESLPTAKPPGYLLEAIDHTALRRVMASYNRLDDSC